MGEAIEGRTILRITGGDRESFLQGLVTNDVAGLAKGPVYTALLTAQGKYLADFFMIPEGNEAVLIDVATTLAPTLYKKLMMYRLRADVQIAEAKDIHVQRGLGDIPAGAHADPRDSALGWRLYGSEAGVESQTDWDALRIGLGVPEGGVDLIPDDSYILESGFERLNGVDFRKGCYVGQEVTARMKHKTSLRKGLVVVEVDGTADPGTPILAGEKPAGTLFSQAGGKGLAYLRFDRAKGDLTAGPAQVRWTEG